MKKINKSSPTNIPMKLWLHKIEVIVDKIIPFCLILLAIVIILEFGFHSFVVEHNLLLTLQIIDYFVILVFIIDLLFKYVRMKDIPHFLRKYWLEIIAVLPFFLLFRLFEFAFGMTEISEGAKVAQALTHESMAVEKEVPAIIKESEAVIKAERSSKLYRFIRPLTKIPRFAKIAPSIIHFFEKPSGKHHSRDIK